MNSPRKVVAELELRGFSELAAQVASRCHLPLDRILSGSHEPELVEARRVLYERFREVLPSDAAVARIFGVDVNTINVAMRASKQIAEVVLDRYRVEEPKPGEPIAFRFLWQRGRPNAFGVAVVVSDATGERDARIDWFEFYPRARQHFVVLCRTAGAPSSYAGPSSTPDESSSGEGVRS